MAISDAQFEAWLTAHNREPVYLLEITGVDPVVTFRASSAPYTKGSNIYRSRISDFDIEWNMFDDLHGGVAKREASIVIDNPDGGLDGWSDTGYDSATLLLGDRSWEYADFRTQLSGTLRKFDVLDEKRIELVCDDELSKADILIDSLSTTTGDPGTLIKALLIDAGAFVSGDLDLTSFTDADTNWPYGLKVAISAESENLLTKIDECLRGFPLNLTVNRAGKVAMVEYVLPTGSTTFLPFKPTAIPEVEFIGPIWRTFATSRWTGTTRSPQDQALIDDNPNTWRENSMTINVELDSDHNNYDNIRWALYNQRMHRVVFQTQRLLGKLELGDEIRVQFPRYGYDAGKYGTVTGITERLNEPNEIEIMVLNDWW